MSDVEGLDVMDVQTWEDFEDAYWWVHKNSSKYKTLIIDTVSQLQQVAIQKIKGKAKNGNWGTMSQRDWGDVSSVLKTWIIDVRNLPCHTVFIAQDRTFNLDDDSGDEVLAPEVGPQLMPSVTKVLNAAVHVLANTFIRQRVEVKKIKKGSKVFTKEIEHIEYCLRVGPSPIYITKVRKPKSVIPPSVLVDPTFEDIMSIVKGK